MIAMVAQASLKLHYLKLERSLDNILESSIKCCKPVDEPLRGHFWVNSFAEQGPVDSFLEVTLLTLSRLTVDRACNMG